MHAGAPRPCPEEQMACRRPPRLPPPADVVAARKLWNWAKEANDAGGHKGRAPRPSSLCGAPPPRRGARARGGIVRRPHGGPPGCADGLPPPAGDVFPIHGTCLGFQLLHILEANVSFTELLVDTDSGAAPRGGC